MKTPIYAIALLITAGFLTACQSTDALVLEAETPLGQPALVGQTPAFEANPSGAAAQLTPQQEAEIRADLQAASAPAATQAAADNAGAYRDGIVRLQKEGDALTQQRLERIQNSTIITDPAQ